jgi:hypothetical protein
MHRTQFWPLLALLWLASPATATDLDKIERRLVKEPKYQSKPEYVLAVFGLEGRHKLWLVLDGRTLYVDRNGNGDLTEANERIQAEAQNIEFQRTFEVGEVRASEGTLLAGNLSVMVHEEGKGTYWEIRVDKPGLTQQQWSSTIHDVGTTAKAQIVHFDGPRSILLDSINRHHMDMPRSTRIHGALRRGKINQVYGIVQTPCTPEGIVVLAHFTFNPQKVHPVAEIEFPNREPGGAPIRQRVELTIRC